MVNLGGVREPGAQSGRAGRWIVRYGRLGYAAKGTVYIVIGLLALNLRSGIMRQPPNTDGVLTALLLGPYGAALVGLLAFGLFGYALWQFVAALVDGEYDGSHTWGWFARLGKLWGAFFYAMLGVEAVRVLLTRLTGREQAEAWTGLLLRLPFGAGLVALVGGGIVTYGLFQFYTAYALPVCRQLAPGVLACRSGRLAMGVGRFGLVARGIIFALVGVLLVRAAIGHDPRQAAGLGESFAALADQTRGPWLLAGVAVGFIAYGSFELFSAWHRRLRAG